MCRCFVPLQSNGTKQRAKKKFIFEAVGDDKYQINLIKTLFHRAMILDPSLYTKYTLAGLTWAWESTFISLIKKILGAQYVLYRTKYLKTSFNCHELNHCLVVVFTTINKISVTKEKFFKQLQGKDKIFFNIKNVEGHFLTLFKGICILHFKTSPLWIIVWNVLIFNN